MSHRRQALDYIQKFNELQADQWGDPEIESKINQYEMAYRMQTAVPDLVDLSDEPDHIYELYGEDARIPGTYASNCLLARRLAEEDVRFIQLYHTGWDQHGGLPSGISRQAKEHRPGHGCLISRLEAAGALRGYASDLGRRIWTNQLFTGPAYRDQLRAGSSPGMLYHVDGRRRSPARIRSWRNR